MNYAEQYAFANEVLSNFKHFIEIEDFRRFLLLTLNLENSGPESMLAQLGMGSKGKIILPYDPLHLAYYNKMLSTLSLKNQVMIYHSSEKKGEFINKQDSPLIMEYLTEKEREESLPTNFMLICPEIVDFTKSSLERSNNHNNYTVGIESLYTHLDEFIATQDLKIIFLKEADKADLAFVINISLDAGPKSDNATQFFDVYVDEAKELRNYTYILTRSEKSKAGQITTTFLNEIKDLSHSEKFDSNYTVIVPVKSFTPFL